ncbi:MAG: hypothetical protein QGM47_11175, partial [Actinomycetota bacterium]|nr:hypothetical protein [Actinomycetota bacterium]
WIRVDDGEWREVESSGPIEPPLEDLASLNSLTIIQSSDDGISVLAAYDGAEFNSENPVDLQLRFVDGLLVSASYATADASVSPIFAPLDGATIENPTANS